MRELKRIYHTWDKWESYYAGFFEDKDPNGRSTEECLAEYQRILGNLEVFEAGLKRVLKEWPKSCEHNLTNESMNRVAWLGQASGCILFGVPSSFRAGYNLLTEEQKHAADTLALKYLNIWLESQGYPQTDGKRTHKTSDMY